MDDLKKHLAKMHLNSVLPLASSSSTQIPNGPAVAQAVTNTASKILMPMIRRIMPTVIANHILYGPALKKLKAKSLFKIPFEPMQELKPRKGRKGRPHWRELRINLLLDRFSGLRESLMASYNDHYDGNSWYMRESQEWNFWTWCKIELEKHNISVVYDIEYESHALHAASDTDLVAFLLIWQGQKLANLEQ